MSPEESVTTQLPLLRQSASCGASCCVSSLPEPQPSRQSTALTAGATCLLAWRCRQKPAAGQAPAEPAQGAWEADPQAPLCLADDVSCRCPPERAAEPARLIAGINNTHRAGREGGEAEAVKDARGWKALSTRRFPGCPVISAGA